MTLATLREQDVEVLTTCIKKFDSCLHIDIYSSSFINLCYVFACKYSFEAYIYSGLLQTPFLPPAAAGRRDEARTPRAPAKGCRPLHSHTHASSSRSCTSPVYFLVRIALWSDTLHKPHACMVHLITPSKAGSTMCSPMLV